MKKEIKAALIGLSSLVSFVLLYNFLKGKDLFNKTNTYYTFVENAEGLDQGKPVLINGFKVGIVEGISLSNDKDGQFIARVKMGVNKDFLVTDSTYATIIDLGLINGKGIRLDIKNIGNQLPPGATLRNRMGGSLMKEIIPMKNKVEHTISLLDSTLKATQKILSEEHAKKIGHLLDNLNGTVLAYKNTASTLENTLGSVKQTSQGVERLVKDNQENIQNTLSQINKASKGFVNISEDLQKAKLGETIKKLQSTLSKVDAVLADINQGKGTAGKFLKDEQLYTNLLRTSKTLEALLVDLKENPKRYVHFSIFGKKNTSYSPKSIDSLLLEKTLNR